jgi:hypothetical protein
VMQVQIMANQHNRGVDRAKIGTTIDDPPVDYAKLAQSMGMYGISRDHPGAGEGYSSFESVAHARSVPRSHFVNAFLFHNFVFARVRTRHAQVLAPPGRLHHLRWAGPALLRWQ